MQWLAIIVFAIAMFSGGVMIGARLEQGRQRDLDNLKYGLAWKIAKEQRELCRDCFRYNDVLDQLAK